MISRNAVPITTAMMIGAATGGSMLLLPDG
jgi:hypothetical protein